MSPDLNRKLKILIADDVSANRDLLRQTLEPEGYDTFLVPSGEIALKVANSAKPDLILLDVKMPNGIDGFETCRRLNADVNTAGIPVIFISVEDEVGSVVRGFQAGGIDYITKPFQKEEVLVRVRTHLEMHLLKQQLQRKNEELSAEITRRRGAEEEREQVKRAFVTADERLTLISEQELDHWGIPGFIGTSPTIARILEDVRKLQAVGTTSVLITGESGTGKELIARAIHYGSSRGKGPFIPLNCSAIPRELAESFLFGHVKGAFTGAHNSRKGCFELADGGSLFLDEIGEMPFDLQAKLLRVLEDRCVTPLGGTEIKQLNVRVLAATNRNLRAAIERGLFREDLYFRLARFTVTVPSLRDRKEDLPLLIEHFLKKLAAEMGLVSPALAAAAREALTTYDFPGNIRELRNILERALIKSSGALIELCHLDGLNNANCGVTRDSASAEAGQATPRAFPRQARTSSNSARGREWFAIQGALAETNGDVPAAAALLGMELSNVQQILGSENQSAWADESRKDEERILAWIRQHGSVNNAECRDALGVDIHRASYLLNKLHRAGRVKRTGEHRWARYTLP